MSDTTQHPVPFRFDGHGINDANGKRLAKVTTEQWTAGPRTEIDPEFKRLSLLMAAAPELQTALEDLINDLEGLAREFYICKEILESCWGKAAYAALKKAKGEQ